MPYTYTCTISYRFLITIYSHLIHLLTLRSPESYHPIAHALKTEPSRNMTSILSLFLPLACLAALVHNSLAQCPALSNFVDGVCTCNVGAQPIPQQLFFLCQPCPGGTFKPFAGNVACSRCPPNSFSVPGSALCTTCPAGLFTVSSQSAVTDCVVPCTAGQFFLPVDSTAVPPIATPSCLPCLPGSASAESGFPLMCPSCLPGTIQPLSGQTACIPCPPGLISNPGRTECILVTTRPPTTTSLSKPCPQREKKCIKRFRRNRCRILVTLIRCSGQKISRSILARGRICRILCR